MIAAPAVQTKLRHYKIEGMSKGPAPIAEMRALLEVWEPGEDAKHLLERVQASGLLGKATAKRTRDMVNLVFRPRLLVPSDQPARNLKQFMQANGDPQTFRELLLIHQARTDEMLYDFITQKLWTAYREGDLFIRHADAVAFFDAAQERGEIRKAWSDGSKQRIGHALLKALTVYGFLRKENGTARSIVPYRMTGAGMAYLAYDLHLSGLSDGAVVEHTDWMLFGLERTALLDRLDMLPASFGMLMQRAGSVVRITWDFSTMEQLVYAITR